MAGDQCTCSSTSLPQGHDRHKERHADEDGAGFQNSGGNEAQRGRSWTYWALLLSGLVSLVYYFVISADYARQGASWADGLLSVLESGIPLFLGAIAGGIALRRGLHAEVSRG